MIEWFGPIVLEYYAATEGNGCTLITSAEWLAHRGSVGRSVLSDIQILDDDGRPCPVGHVGHGVVRRRHRLRVLQRPRQDGRSAAGRRQDATVGDVATSMRTAICT